MPPVIRALITRSEGWPWTAAELPALDGISRFDESLPSGSSIVGASSFGGGVRRERAGGRSDGDDSLEGERYVSDEPPSLPSCRRSSSVSRQAASRAAWQSSSIACK